LSHELQGCPRDGRGRRHRRGLFKAAGAGRRGRRRARSRRGSAAPTPSPRSRRRRRHGHCARRRRLRSATEVFAAVAKCRDALGPVSILVNNAGVTDFTPFEQVTDELWDFVYAVNVRGPMILTQAVLPDMKAAHWGRIVNISSSSRADRRDQHDPLFLVEGRGGHHDPVDGAGIRPAGASPSTTSRRAR
jgi:NAD(P)-dependent dehydrogenase (short-subunit alcohol dehydrogenase family)